MPNDALLIGEDGALSIHPDGDALIVFDSETGAGAECCCGGCAPNSRCCPGDPSFCGNNVPTNQRGGCFHTQYEQAIGCPGFHGPVSYRFAGTVQTAYPTRNTIVQGSVRRRIFEYTTIDLDLSQSDLILPRDGISVASQMGGVSLGKYLCEDYDFRVGQQLTGQGHNGITLSAVYPLFGAQVILQDTLLFTYTTGNDGANGFSTYTTTGQIRAMVLATFVNRWEIRAGYDAETRWPPVSFTTKAGYNRRRHDFFFPGVPNFKDDGVWMLTLHLYHARLRVVGGDFPAPGWIIGGIDPTVSVGGRSKHAVSYVAASSGGALQGFDTDPSAIDYDGTVIQQFSRGPSATVGGYVNACGCVNRVCGTVDAACKFVNQQFQPPTTSQTDAHQDYTIDFDVSWGGLSKCDADTGDSNSAGTCSDQGSGADESTSGAFI